MKLRDHRLDLEMGCTEFYVLREVRTPCSTV